MSTLLSGEITTVAEFFAHALELEVESADRYEELAHNMEAHNNLEVAGLFHKLAEYGVNHADAVKRQASVFELPVIPPWGFKWTCPEGPESPCEQDMHYLMSKCEALAAALHNEIRGRNFYAQVAASSPNSDVRQIAAQMAAEESSHVEMLQEWFAREACEAQPPVVDLDPPNMPE